MANKMKTKVTLREVKNGYNTILSIDYCGLQTLLNYKSPFAYNCGMYGWNCDFYDVDGVCLCTGYRTVGVRPDYKLIKSYEEKAEKLNLNRNLSFKVKERYMAKLLSEFVTKAKESISK